MIAAVREVLAWWRRRIALRRAPRMSEIERLRATLATEAKRHGRTALIRRRLTAAMSARLAAEQGKRFHQRKSA